MSKIEELENKLMELQKEFEVFKNKEEKENKGWIPKFKNDYYYYDRDTEEIENTIWANYDSDNTRLKNKVIFKTFEEAKEYAEYIRAKKEYSHEFSKEEWENDDIRKYIIGYDYDREELYIDFSNCCRNSGQIYFKTREKTQEFRDKYEKQILKFEFEIE